MPLFLATALSFSLSPRSPHTALHSTSGQVPGKKILNYLLKIPNPISMGLKSRSRRVMPQTKSEGQNHRPNDILIIVIPLG